ncbi:hypothetical protein D6783_01175 [Candidatus Woesearchaeota archaeon]|nr:MAG: hypothetical protein D6783_01175 [Candidatus Woesearchaeota archaeon]
MSRQTIIYKTLPSTAERFAKLTEGEYMNPLHKAYFFKWKPPFWKKNTGQVIPGTQLARDAYLFALERPPLPFKDLAQQGIAFVATYPHPTRPGVLAMQLDRKDNETKISLINVQGNGKNGKVNLEAILTASHTTSQRPPSERAYDQDVSSTKMNAALLNKFDNTLPPWAQPPTHPATKTTTPNPPETPDYRALNHAFYPLAAAFRSALRLVHHSTKGEVTRIREAHLKTRLVEQQFELSARSLRATRESARYEEETPSFEALTYITELREPRMTISTTQQKQNRHVEVIRATLEAKSTIYLENLYYGTVSSTILFSQ